MRFFMPNDTSDNSNDKSKTAILLDDNLMSTMRIQSQLEREGYVLKVTRQLPSDEQAAPQLVVINLGSRGINGVELARESTERFPTARVVGFCGHLETEIRQAARAAGIHKLLTNEQAFSDLTNSL
jgi:DNA-binding NarL/FixJ family response regulator